jgi:hypothetical protein
MKNYLICIVGVLLLSACNKYKDFDGDGRVSGHARIVGDLSDVAAIPAAGKTLYINPGADSSTYIAQVVTDSAGAFTLSSVKGGQYIVYTRYLQGNVEYQGSVSVTAGSSNVVLNIYPVYTNGISILFTDSLGGPVSRLPFRLYTSAVAASVDSVSYASQSGVSDVNGKYNAYNIATMKYYIVAKDSIGPLHRKILDSIPADANKMVSKTVVLK